MSATIQLHTVIQHLVTNYLLVLLCAVHICEEDKAAFNDRLEEDLHGYVNNCLINTPDDLQTLRSCTSPVCTVEGYALRQCYHQWCWCVTRDGNVIENTLRLSQDMPDNFCGKLSDTFLTNSAVLCVNGMARFNIQILCYL